MDDFNGMDMLGTILLSAFWEKVLSEPIETDVEEQSTKEKSAAE